MAPTRSAMISPVRFMRCGLAERPGKRKSLHVALQFRYGNVCLRSTSSYEFASSYSYIAAMRIAPVAKAAAVTVRWRPFLLGPIFKAQGWDTSPFNLYPAKGRYMVRDCERQCAALGLTFRLPEPFPQNTLLAARVATAALAEGWGEDFSRAV